ncbi:MAG TPA: GGDEF domain-containing protein [Noviherbaspirillum sp.]|uniref:GGDEF domain-containing protein n=1 Tax=Noviherbaspirillum sp. TaxID=1926288 RepID=UPI002D6AEB5A|nr:GGDEF domain-containing protein [Noviherbaspirillum sp.]HYD94599.1 GGDEF domain-containing protein [Noviherbaspirillum sp.]
MRKLKTWLLNVAERLVGVLPQEALGNLVVPFRHSSLLARRRAELVVSRVRMVAGLFAVLTPLWIVVDLLVFSWPLTIMLVIGRIVTSIAFLLLAWRFRGPARMPDAYRALAIMFVIPTLFFIYSHPMLSQFKMEGPAAAIAAGYAFLPFVMVAGLAVFPLTALEGVLFALPVLAAEALVALLQLDLLNWSSHLGAVWLLMLIATVASLSGMSQLSFMISLLNNASHDTVTGCFTRASGEELLDIQFHIASRGNAALSVVFLDVDRFKQVNDQFGHDAGDRVLATLGERLRSTLRTGDIVLRWGGEEFVIVLPGASLDTARAAVERLRETGLGLRPDGSRVTASFGIAERVADCGGDWQQLVSIADQRMFLAKQAGRDCVKPDPDQLNNTPDLSPEEKFIKSNNIY